MTLYVYIDEEEIKSFMTSVSNPWDTTRHNEDALSVAWYYSCLVECSRQAPPAADLQQLHDMLKRLAIGLLLNPFLLSLNR